MHIKKSKSKEDNLCNNDSIPKFIFAKIIKQEKLIWGKLSSFKNHITQIKELFLCANELHIRASSSE